MKIERIVGLLAGVCALHVGAGLAAADEGGWRYSAPGVTSLDVSIDSGEVELVAARAAEASIESLEGYDSEKCEVLAVVKNGTLTFSTKAKRTGVHRWFGNMNRCKARFKITALPTTKLHVEAGAGRIRVEGFSAGAALRSGAGSMELKNLSGPLNIETGTGNVMGEIYSEDLEASTGVGGMDISWIKSPERGQAKVKTGVGSISLAFPEGTKVNTSYRGGIGRFSSELDDSRTSGFRISAETGVGSLRILKEKGA